MDTLFGLFVTAVCMWGCYTLAERKGRNTTIALICGLLFSWIAFIVYALLGTKNKNDNDMGIDA